MQIAQVLKISGVPGEIIGPLNTDPDKPQYNNLADIVNIAMPYLFSIAGIILFLMLVWGGFEFLTSMGDPKKAEGAKNKITSAIIGIVILFMSYWVVQLIDIFFGFKIF